MKLLILLALPFLFISVVRAQVKTNSSIEQQLKVLGSDGIEVAFDAGSNVTTLRAVAENFRNDEVRRSGVRAMNFAAGVIYPGSGIEHSPEQILLTFWVLSSKPRFGEDHTFSLFIGSETMQLGEGRYVARVRDGMEYLNYSLTREQLRSIAQQSNVRFLLGRAEFTFTKSQLKLLADLYLATEVTK